MSRLIIQESTIAICPSLAKQIGLNEAIMVQQIHYWQDMKKNLRDGRYWVYNSITQWEKQFPFWSYSTIRRTLASLKEKGIVETGNYNKDRRDKSLWYSLNYEHPMLDVQTEGSEQMQDAKMNSAPYQDGMMDGANKSEPLPKTTTKNTTKNKNNDGDAYVTSPDDPLFDVGQPKPKRFKIELDWRPDQAVLIRYCNNAGCQIVNRPDWLMNEIIGEWVNYWHAEGSIQSESKWYAKLSAWIKRKLADHDSQPAKRTRKSGEPGKTDYRSDTCGMELAN